MGYWCGVYLGCIYILHLGVYLGLRSKKAENSGEAEQWRSKEAEKQRSREAGKEKTEKQKAEKQNSGEAEKQRSIKAEAGKQKSKKTAQNGKNKFPQKNSPPFQINIVAGRNSCSLIHTGKIVGVEF